MSLKTIQQVALAVKVDESKALINGTYYYGVTCTYSELRRFKHSAARAAIEDKNLVARLVEM